MFAKSEQARSKEYKKIRHTRTQATIAPEPLRGSARQAQGRTEARARARDAERHTEREAQHSTHKERGRETHTERQRDTTHTERSTTDSSTIHKDTHSTHTNIVQYNSRQDTHTMV